MPWRLEGDPRVRRELPVAAELNPVTIPHRMRRRFPLIRVEAQQLIRIERTLPRTPERSYRSR
jgi:hypothetical protein